MARKDRAVSDAGPIIHLHQITLLNKFLSTFEIYIPEEVSSEIKKHAVYVKAKKLDLKPRYKDFARMLVEKYVLGLGESEAISLALQEKIRLFFTDDLDARTAAKEYGLEAHGTVGIILRMYSNGVISKEDAKKKVYALKEKSSLFIAKELVEWIVKEIEDYKK